MKIKKSISIIVILVILLSFFGCSKNGIDAVSPTNKEENVLLVSKTVYSYYSMDYVFENIESFVLANSTIGDAYFPEPVKLEWSDKKESSYYTVLVSKNKDLSDCIESIVEGEKEVTIKNLEKGTTYYWQVIADGERKSKIFTFSTELMQPRTIRLDGVSNSRDIGGFYTVDGKRVKQGMIYRCARLEATTPEGARQAKELGIKTEIDLRSQGETTYGISPLGASVKYENFDCPYYDDIFYIKQENLRDIIRQFADERNYPIIFHCQIGRDRTGTIAMLINGLLGVEEDDLYRDYEMSYFSKITSGESFVKPSTMQNQFSNMLIKMKVDSGCDYLDPPQEAIEQFVLSLGVTENEIKEIRRIMLED